MSLFDPQAGTGSRTRSGRDPQSAALQRRYRVITRSRLASAFCGMPPECQEYIMRAPSPQSDEALRRAKELIDDPAAVTCFKRGFTPQQRVGLLSGDRGAFLETLHRAMLQVLPEAFGVRFQQCTPSVQQQVLRSDHSAFKSTMAVWARSVSGQRVDARGAMAQSSYAGMLADH